MATKRTLTEAEALEQYRVALNNAETQPEIAAVMAEFGYDSKGIKTGKTLLTDARTAYDSNRTEDDETSAAYNNFEQQKEKLAESYNLHRKKAKVVFRNDPVTLDRLAVSGVLPKAYVTWLETVKKFYVVVAADPTITQKLAKLKFTAEDIAAANAVLGKLENARAVYLLEKGESQEATKAKDAAMVAIDDWMSEFYAVAKIALEDKPQLLEALGKLVRS